MSEDELADTYWICDACAKSQGWTPPNWAVTGIIARCSYCKGVIADLLIPIVDYKRPGQAPPVWD